MKLRQVRDHLNTVIASCALRLRGAEIGPHFHVAGLRPHWRGTGRLRTGPYVILGAVSVRVAFNTFERGAIDIGERTFLNNGVEILCEQSVVIGAHCRIGPYAVLTDTGNHQIDEGGIRRVAAVELRRNVWLGRGVIVLPGVTIGENAVVGAGSVVTRDVPANEVWAGNPARFVRKISTSPGFVRR